MAVWLAVAAGGAVGAVLRYATILAAAASLGRAFPYATLLVNVSGSLFIGLLYAYYSQTSLSPEWRTALQVGFLGAFTTFSTFSLETLQLINSGEHVKALLNIVLSVVVCILACWLGLVAGRRLWS